MEGNRRAEESDSSREQGDESSEVTQADLSQGEEPSASHADAEPQGDSDPKSDGESKRAPRPSSVSTKGGSLRPSSSALSAASKPPPFPSARPARSAPLPPPPERPHPPSAAPPSVAARSESPRAESPPSESAHAVAAPDLKDATEPEPEGPPIQSITSLPVRELELMKSELAQLKAQTQRQGLLRASIPYVVLAIGAVTLGYLLGDSTASRRRTEVRKVAMERYFAAESALVDAQKDVLTFIQKELAADDPELKRWAKSQVTVLEERLAARGEREAALKADLATRGEEIARLESQVAALEAENKSLGEKILAFEAVAKKLEQLKLANIVLIQAKTNIERLSRRLSDIEDSPEAKRLEE